MEQCILIDRFKIITSFILKEMVIFVSRLWLIHLLYRIHMYLSVTHNVKFCCSETQPSRQWKREVSVLFQDSASEFMPT